MPRGQTQQQGMPRMGNALRQLLRQLRGTPWLCDGLVLGATVATISSTSALAYSSALMRAAAAAAASASSRAAAAASAQQLSNAPHLLPMTAALEASTCHECIALRLYSLSRAAASPASVSPLLGFSMDSLLTEMLMSFLISFVIVTFSVFLVREMR